MFESELQSIYILKEYQRRAIGTALVMRLVSWLLADGKNSMFAGYYGNNPYVSFYQKLDADLGDGSCVWPDLRRLSKNQGWT